MITCNIMGGLGNQLFQIFTTISYAIKYKREFGFLYTDFVGVGKTIRRNTYWKTFLKGISKYVYTSLPQMNIVPEVNFHYNELDVPNSENICLFGYFQSYKYFKNYANVIIRLLKIEDIKQKIIEKISLDNDWKTTVSLHFRLGDYKLITEAYPLLKYEYYDNSLEFLLKDHDKEYIKTVIYFCEKQDEADVNLIINKLKYKYSFLEFSRVSEELEDWEQLLLMSCCNFNIIANSTFSWWGAYLNNNDNKIVCYPEKWFGPKKNNLNTNDLFLPTWYKIACL